MSEAFIARPFQTPVLDLGTFDAAILATGEQTGGAFSVLQTLNEPHDFGPPMHIHHDAAEAFYVLEGDYLMFIEDRQEVCSAGTFVYVPQGMAHTFKVVSETPGRKLNVFAPAAMIGFFSEVAASKAAGTLTPEMVDELGGRHAMEIVGPVPDSYLRPG